MLDLNWNKARNLSPLFSLTRLTALELDGNQITNLEPLSTLINLNELGLRYNRIIDIKPLVENAGLADFDVVYLGGNQLSQASMNIYIPQLSER